MVEIFDTDEASFVPPHDFTLIAQAAGPGDPPSQRFLFQSSRKRKRRGEIKPLLSLEADASQEVSDSTYTAGNGLGYHDNIDSLSSTERARSSVEAHLRPFANESRTRSPVHSRNRLSRDMTARNGDTTGKQPHPIIEDKVNSRRGQKSPLQRVLRKGDSVKHLVEFWNKDRPRIAKQSAIAPFEERPNLPRLSIEAVKRLPDSASSGAQPGLLRTPSHAFEWTNRSRRCSVSSTMSVDSTASDTSLVLHAAAFELGRHRSQVHDLRRKGFVPGSFPSGSFVHNVARFSRFSVAAYGSRLLRWAGGLSEHYSLNTLEQAKQLPEHRTFTSYTGMPPSTVLLSSFLDPQGGTNIAGKTDSGMPLVHFLSVDHASKAVVFTCRGTLGFDDILTDMICDYDDIEWRGRTYQVHKGAYASARRILTMHGGRVMATIKAALEEFEDYGFVLCGHSLGGSVAAILGILLAETSTTSAGGTAKYVTARQGTAFAAQAFSLPPNRPIHVYAYGPAACASPALQQGTTELITTIVYGQDVVPYLSLGNLRDSQVISLAFKTDDQNTKGEVRRRISAGLSKAFKDRTGLNPVMLGEWSRSTDDDDWAWETLVSLRASMTAPKLVPPGDVFIADSQPVLQRHAFVGSSKRKTTLEEGSFAGSAFRPATHVKLTYITDVEKRFGEVRFGASMFTDHFPVRYQRALEVLEQGLSV